MLDQREAPITGAEDQPVEQPKRPSRIAAFNVGGLNLAPASNDETFDLSIDAAPVDATTPDLFNEGGAGNKSFDTRSSEFYKELGMQADVKLGNNGGPLGQLTLQEIEERKRERAEEAIEAFLEQAAEHEKEVKAAQAKWDAEMHDYGGEKLSGAEIMRRIEWFEKKENQDKVRDQLRKQGKTEQEIEETIRKMKERDELMKRQRNGEKLSPEEQLRLNMLNKDKQVIEGSQHIAEGSKKDNAKKIAHQVEEKALTQDGKSAVSKFSDLQEKSASGKGLTAAEAETLKALQADAQVVAATKLFDGMGVGPTPASDAKALVAQQNTAPLGASAPPTNGHEDFPNAGRIKAEFNVGGLAQVAAAPTASADIRQAPEASKPAVEETKIKLSAAKVEASAAAFM